MNDDTISRQAAIRFIRDKVSLSLFMKRSVDKADKACMELCEMLDKDLPSAERRGRWINGNEGKWNGVIVPKCSICGETFYEMNVNINGEYTYNYCPNCGARMVEEVNPCDTCENAKYTNLEDDDSICRDCGVEE